MRNIFEMAKVKNKVGKLGSNPPCKKRFEVCDFPGPNVNCCSGECGHAGGQSKMPLKLIVFIF